MVDYDLFLPTRFTGDPGRIRQVLTNLAGNAVKFTKEGHVTLRVTGISAPDSEICSVHITIEDTGIGIPAEKVDHIFGEFNQVEDERNRKFEGTGLGLAISKRLIELMGGEIWVDSEEGKGSCFGLRVPLPLEGDGGNTLPELPKTLRHVLLVDDRPLNREILQKHLLMLGIQVTTADNAAAARAAIGTDIDLVISGHNPPALDGVELARDLKSGPRHDVPLLLLNSSPQACNGLQVGDLVSGILQYPTPRSDLFDHLARLGREAAAPACDTPDPHGKQQAAPAAAGATQDHADNTGPGQRDQSAEDVAALQATPPQADNAPDAPAPVLRRMRVLAAEDNKTNQLVFRKMVKDLDIELRFANNGIEAVEAFKAFEPDLVFMDISMPMMDGKEATVEIRKIEADTGGHVPIVALTAHAMTGDSDAILAAGLDHYLTKPLRKALIHEKLHAFAPADALPLTPATPPAAAEAS